MNRVGRCLSGLVGFLLLLGTAEAQSGAEMVPLYQEGGAFTPCQEDAGFSSLEPLLQVRLVQFVPADHPEAPRPEGCRLGYSYDGVDWFFLDLPITSIRYLLTPNRKHLLVVGEQAAPYPGTTLHHFNLAKAKPKLHTMHPFHHDLKQYDLNFYTVLPLPGEDEARYFLPSSKPSLEIPEDPKHPDDDPENDEGKIPYGDYDIELRVSRWSRFPENRDDHFSLFFCLGQEIQFNPDPKLYEPLFQERVKRLGDAVANDYPYYLYGYLSGHFSLTEMVKALFTAPTREVAPELEVNCDTPGEQFTTRIEDKLAFINVVRNLENKGSPLVRGNSVEKSKIISGELYSHEDTSSLWSEIPERLSDDMLVLCSSQETPFTIAGTSIRFGLYKFNNFNNQNPGNYSCNIGYSYDGKKIFYLTNSEGGYPLYIMTPNQRFLLIEEKSGLYEYILSLFRISGHRVEFLDSISGIVGNIITTTSFSTNLRNMFIKNSMSSSLNGRYIDQQQNRYYEFEMYMNQWSEFAWDEDDNLVLHMIIDDTGIHLSKDIKLYDRDYKIKKDFRERMFGNFYSYYFSGYLGKHFALTEVVRALLNAPTIEKNEDYLLSYGERSISTNKSTESIPTSSINDKINFFILLNSLKFFDAALHEDSRNRILKSHPEENDHGESR